MAYIDGERLAAEQVASVTGFSTTNVGRGSKWKYLNIGDSDHYAILHKGQWVEDWTTLQEAGHNHRTLIDVIQKVTTANDQTLVDNYDNLLTYVDDIVTRLEQYRKLGDTSSIVRDANVTGGDDVKELWINQGTTLAWIYTTIYLDWSEDERITFAE